MTDIRFRHLEKYKVGETDAGMQLSVPIPMSPSGKSYRECPDTNCSPRLFQLGDAPQDRAINVEHRKLICREPGTSGTTCPYCGRSDDDHQFDAHMDIEAIKEQIGYEALRDVHDHLKEITRDFNKKSSGGLFSLKLQVSSVPPSRPLAIREDLLRELTCNVCRRTYAVYAIALYCPDCGAPALAAHFSREMELVGLQLELSEAKQNEYPELGYRILGNAHEDVLTAFETAQKTLYRHLVRHRLPDHYDELCTQRVIGNAFQNIDRSRALFANLSLDPFDALSIDDSEVLNLNIQKRHVIGHNLSLADDRYQTLAKDARPGQTIALMRDDVMQFATVTAKVVSVLDAQLVRPMPISR